MLISREIENNGGFIFTLFYLVQRDVDVQQIGEILPLRRLRKALLLKSRS